MQNWYIYSFDGDGRRMVVYEKKKKKKKRSPPNRSPRYLALEWSTHSLVSREDMISIRWETSCETQSSPHTILCTGVLQLTTEERNWLLINGSRFFFRKKVTGVDFEHRVFDLSTNT